MLPTPARFSIADIWEQTNRFVRREAGLLMPLAFATTGVGTLLWDLATPTMKAGTRAEAGPWVLVLVPVTLLFLLGNIAVASLVLNGGISVREALRAAFQRLGNALTMLLLFLLGVLALTVVISVVAMLIGLGVRWPAQQATSFGLILMAPAIVFLAVRLLTVWPAVAATPPTPAPIRTARAAYRSTRGVFGRLAAAILLYAMAYLVILAAVQFGLGSAFLLLGRATGQVAAMAMVVSVLSALAGAAMQAIWGVFCAFLYIRLSDASTGT